MNKNYFIIFAFILMITPTFVSAQPAPGQGLLGGIDSEILQTVINILQYPIPPFQIPGYAGSGELKPTPLWLLVAISIIVYAVLWASSSYVPLFRDNQNRKPRIAMVIGLTAIVVFLTPVLQWILYIVGLFTTLSIIGILVAGVFLIWVIMRGSLSSSAVTNANSTRGFADARARGAETAQSLAETARERAKTDEYIQQTQHAAQHGLTQQRQTINHARTALQNIAADLNRVLTAGRFPPDATATNNLRNHIITLNDDLGAIQTFKTQNDRVLAGMTNTLYNETNVGSLNSTTKGTKASKGVKATPNLIDIKKATDSETGDLGRTLAGMMQIIHTGLRTKKDTQQAYEYAVIGDKTLARMERDVGLEIQMINQL